METTTEETRKFKDIDAFDIPSKVTNNLIWVREVLSLLDKGYEAEDDSNDREGSVKPIFLIGEALDKLTEAEQLNEELWDRYKAVKQFVKESPEIKRFAKEELRKLKGA
jgi:hypothetical protein